MLTLKDIESQIVDIINKYVIDKKISLDDIDEPFTGARIGISGDNLYDLLRIIEREMGISIRFFDHYSFYSVRKAAETIRKIIND